ncbi:MAG: 50S ribosomal protein L29 [Chloroflexi bacterium]|nr:MAG: 50S ribosomal protein L29 [Chloroflexota bacterium]PIE80147.1 MAG: 50S ribosomal protein L29 [Chloroflexota bacterium]
MANIVELRELDEAKLEEMLEDAREALFKLRFRDASAQLEDYAQIKVIRREIAQLLTVLNMRQKAVEAAVSVEDIAAVLEGKAWEATARFDYEESAYQVEFVDDGGAELASASVNLNKKKLQGRRARQTKAQPQLVTSYKVAG